MFFTLTFFILPGLDADSEWGSISFFSLRLISCLCFIYWRVHAFHANLNALIYALVCFQALPPISTFYFYYFLNVFYFDLIFMYFFHYLIHPSSPKSPHCCLYPWICCLYAWILLPFCSIPSPLHLPAPMSCNPGLHLWVCPHFPC